MKIENVKYHNDKLGIQSAIKATIDDRKMFVPLDPANRHYQAVQEWVKEGNTIEDAD